jgi:hypothetical protein
MGVVGVIELRFRRHDYPDLLRPGLDQLGVGQVCLRGKLVPAVRQPFAYRVDSAADSVRHQSVHIVSLAQATENRADAVASHVIE